MSLLMDALEKAELAKRRAQPDNVLPATTSPVPSASVAQSGTDKSAAEYPPSVTGGNDSIRLPNLPEHLEKLDHQFDTKSANNNISTQTVPAQDATAAAALSLQDVDAPSKTATPAVAAVAAPTDHQRATVSNLFEARHETKRVAPSRRLFNVVVGVATLCSVLAISFYFRTELQPKSGLQASSAIITAPPVTPLPQLPQLPIAPAITAQLLRSDGPALARKESPAAKMVQPAAARAANSQDKKLFQVSKAAPLTTHVLDQAYDALARGDNAVAKAAYDQSLSNDPRNADALSGLAVIAQRSGNAEAAADYYLQMLDADPENAAAMAGLMNLQSRMDPAVAETRLHQALASQPDSPALNFSLGNIYARGKRWADAQQAFFKAVTGDHGNPDYLFNLAVSVDQMHQPRLAEKYYVQAVAAAEARPAGFDKARANERLLKLQQKP